MGGRCFASGAGGGLPHCLRPAVVVSAGVSPIGMVYLGDGACLRPVLVHAFGCVVGMLQVRVRCVSCVRGVGCWVHAGVSVRGGGMFASGLRDRGVYTGWGYVFSRTWIFGFFVYGGTVILGIRFRTLLGRKY